MRAKLNGNMSELIKFVEGWDLLVQVEDLAAWIAWVETTHIETEAAVKEAKLRHKKKVMEEMLKSIRKNATEKKAEAEVEAFEDELKIIPLETTRDLVEARLNYLVNKFTSARKLANLREKQILNP